MTDRQPLNLKPIKGLVWRHNGEIVINPGRPFIRSLDDLPLPLPRHDLLPLDKYRAPLVRGPYAFIVTICTPTSLPSTATT